MKRVTKLGIPLLLAAILIGALLGPAGASAAKHKRAVLKVRILQNKQQAILKHGLQVKVVSGKKRKVRLRSFSSTFDDRSARLTKTRTVRFRKGGKRSVRLTLTKAGRIAVRKCAARKIVAKAGARKSRLKRMTRNAKPCRLPQIDMRNASRCDFITNPTQSICMVPFPDDYYSRPDQSSPTGRRIAFQTAAMPENSGGKHIEALPYNDSDGFSQGSTILLKIPGVETAADVAALRGAPINHIGRFADQDAGVVVIDAQTGERWPIWTEIDSLAKDRSKALVEVHPAVNFASGHRYVVALRDLRNAAGTKIEAPAAFRYYRDEIPSQQQQIRAQWKRYRSIFGTLKRAGVRRDSLYLAWDFTVASDINNAGRALAMRDQSFADLGDINLADRVPQGVSPKFSVTSSSDDGTTRRVKGTFEVPCYLHPSCAPGGNMELLGNRLPARSGTWTANFDCIVPASVTSGPGGAGRPSLYGHGLFGSAAEVASAPQQKLAEDHEIVFCATDEIGMSSSDLGNTLAVLNDLSKFPQLADRLQQGLLNELYLGRAMISPDGFTTDPAFHQDGTLGSEPVLNRDRLFYNGNSQGGIMGGALTAIAPDFTRAALGVPAMNYSVLLPRSVDFDDFSKFLYPAYPDETARPLLLDIIQMLWDRGDPNGYAHRMTSNPLPNTPAHQVLMNVAFGDHQVSNYQADVQARTIGASAHAPALYNGRWPDTDVLWNVPAIGSYPFAGSAIYYWDTGPVRSEGGETVGVPPPPYGNVPPREGEDPHGAPRASAAEQQLVSDFFEGAIPAGDQCAGGPCYAGTFTGP